jgi:hypothetical protein
MVEATEIPAAASLSAAGGRVASAGPVQNWTGVKPITEPTRPMKILSTLPLLLILPLLSVSAAEEPGDSRESILFIGSPPRFGTLDGAKFQYREVSHINDNYGVYM